MLLTEIFSGCKRNFVLEFVKQLLRQLGLYEYIRYNLDLLKSYKHVPTNSTILVHIGKCGGKSLRDGISNIKWNSSIYVAHGRKPVYRKDLNYIIVARGPISRTISAFRWRHKIVVTTGKQANTFKGEYEVLSKYKEINNLAEALYHENGELDISAHQEMQKIHHIYEGISYYLTDLLAQCKPEQIIAVLMQENLDEDIFRVFGYKNKFRAHANPARRDEQKLSEIGEKNLTRYLQKDYEALLKLYCWGKIDRKVFLRAI